MRATLNNRTGLYSLDDPNAPQFHRFVAGLGYLDPKGKDHFAKHWFCAVGETEGHEYVFMTAEPGDLETIARNLTNWKDDLCVEKVYLDGTDLESRRYLYHHGGPTSWDGLTGYRSDGETPSGKEKRHHKSDFWPNFRNWETVAHLVPVPDSVRVNLMAGYDLILALEKLNRIEYRSQALMIATIRREEKKDDVINHPLMRAAIWTIMMLERTRPSESEFKQPEPIYGNLPK